MIGKLKKKKISYFQSGGSYRRSIQLIVGIALGLIIGLFTVIVFGSDIKDNDLQTSLFVVALIFPFVIIFLHDLKLNYFTRASFPKILLVTFLVSILGTYVLSYILHSVFANIYLTDIELGGLVQLLAPVVYFPLFIIAWLYMKWK